MTALLLSLLLLIVPLFGSCCTTVKPDPGAEYLIPVAERVVCQTCEKEGRKSTVEVSSVMGCTLLYCGGGYYDEDGAYHAPKPCNSCSREYRCSNSHVWSVGEPSW